MIFFNSHKKTGKKIGQSIKEVLHQPFNSLGKSVPDNFYTDHYIYGFDAKGQKDFTDIKWEGNNILLFGSEGFGMRQHTGKYADFFVKININEDIESLNISNSAAIVFHHLSYLKKKS